MVMVLCHNFVSERTNGPNLIKFCICIDLNQILVGVVTRQFSQVKKRVMALDYRQNFVSAEYLLNASMELNHFFSYALTLTRFMLGLLRVNFRKFTTRLWPLVVVKISVSAQYLGDRSMDCYLSKILHLHRP